MEINVTPNFKNVITNLKSSLKSVLKSITNIRMIHSSNLTLSLILSKLVSALKNHNMILLCGIILGILDLKLNLNFELVGLTMFFIPKKHHLCNQPSLKNLERRMGLIAQNTILNPFEVIFAKKLVYITCQAYRKHLILTPEEFIRCFAHRMPNGGKLYQHILFSLYPNIHFPKENIDACFPHVRRNFTPNNSYSLSDLNNFQTISTLQKESIFQDGILYLEVTPEEHKKFGYELTRLSLENTKQMFADMQWVTEAFRKYLDEKKGNFSPMSGHVHFEDELIMPHACKQLVYAQFNSIKALNKENQGCFKPLLYDLAGIIGNNNICWEQKNTMFQETFKRYLPRMPEKNMPSWLFGTSNSYEDQQLMNLRQVNNTYVVSDSFSNIEKTQNALVLGISAQGQRARQNFINSPYGCKKIKQMILDHNKQDFSTWSGWTKGFSNVDLD